MSLMSTNECTAFYCPRVYSRETSINILWSWQGCRLHSPSIPFHLVLPPPPTNYTAGYFPFHPIPFTTSELYCWMSRNHPVPLNNFSKPLSNPPNKDLRGQKVGKVTITHSDNLT